MLEKGYIKLIETTFPSLKVTEDPDVLKQKIDNLISELCDRERLIIQARFGLRDNKAKTLQEIGDSMGVTRERVRQLERRALRRLKHPSRSKKLW